MKSHFYLNQGKFFANIIDEASPRLPPGAYNLKINNMGQIYFQPFEIRGDNILDLPSSEYTRLVSEMMHFLKPETRQKFKDFGYLYKRSAMLHGKAGSGKSVLINRVARDTVASGGVALYVTNPALLETAYNYLETIQPDVVTLTILEEFDEFIANGHETTLLKLLDAQIQKQNVITLATTNHIDRIPKRMMRPGRFSSVIEVFYPNAEARKMYLTHKLGKEYKKMDMFVEMTNGLSIDELKECVQSVEIFGKSLDETIKRILHTRDGNLGASSQKSFLDEEDGMFDMKAQLSELEEAIEESRSTFAIPNFRLSGK